MMPLIVGAGLSFDRVLRDTRVRDVALGASVLVVVAQLTSRDLSYYEKGEGLGLYDPAPVMGAVERVFVGVPLPEISQVGPPPTYQPKPGAIDLRDNDGLIWGI